MNFNIVQHKLNEQIQLQHWNNQHAKLREASWYYDRLRLIGAHSLFSKDLYGHYGCVNAIDFSLDGELLASGSDDRRILLWKCEEIKQANNFKPCQLKTEHLSNIFCLSFDSTKSTLFSAGNDEYLLHHDIASGDLIYRYLFDEPIYAMDRPLDGEPILATASESGLVEIIDTRDSAKRLKLASSHGSFHGVSINPVDSQLVATANSIDGIKVYDRRSYKKPLLNFGSKKRRNESKGFMSIRFNYTGRKILALQRKSVPILYDIMNPDKKVRFAKGKYENMVTMKSGCFAGDKDQYVVSGSDNFSIFLWKIRENSETSSDDGPYMVLNGHRSIVNQVRYNRHCNLLASSGVEKVIKVWSHYPMCGCSGDLYNNDNCMKRKPYTHEEYLELTHQLGVQMTHNYDTQSTEEDHRMIAFFDSLIERNHLNNESDSSDSEDNLGKVENILEILLSQYEQRVDIENEASNSSTDAVVDSQSIFGTSLEELRRIFRSDRRNACHTNTAEQMTEQTLDQTTEQTTDKNEIAVHEENEKKKEKDNEYDPHDPNCCEDYSFSKNSKASTSSSNQSNLKTISKSDKPNQTVSTASSYESSSKSFHAESNVCLSSSNSVILQKKEQCNDNSKTNSILPDEVLNNDFEDNLSSVHSTVSEEQSTNSDTQSDRFKKCSKKFHNKQYRKYRDKE